jgi:hypothetical protein
LYKSKRHQLEALRSQLYNELTSFIPTFKDLADYVSPRRIRLTGSDVNKGDRRNQKIVDSTATLSLRTLQAGMMSGVTSPARPWFRLTTPDPELAEFGPVKEWLHLVQGRMGTSFLRSNLYNSLPTVYGDQGLFATAAMMVEKDKENVMHTRVFPVGSYMIAQDSRGRVNVFMREFRMTVRQLVDTFGEKRNGKYIWDNFSEYVKRQWDECNYETWVDVCHAITPNADYKIGSIVDKEMKFSSSYFERGQTQGNTPRGSEENKFLRESGYDYFPVLCPRWEVAGEDVYGTNCPGMVALGDVKMLQVVEKRIAQAIEKMINPPIVAPMSMKNSALTILPGGISYGDMRENGQGFRPAHEVRAPLQEIEQKQIQTRERIRRALFEDLFLMLANSDRRQITAREIDERHEEKLLALGPVLEQLNQDLLDPLIDITFDLHLKQNLIPPPPEELHGVALKVEYVSILAQAQKFVGRAGIDTFAGFCSQIVQLSPPTMDKLNLDQFVDVYADITGVPPTLVRTDEEVAEIRAGRAQEQQQQQQMAMMQQGALAAKDLSQAKLEGTDVLSRALGVPAAVA